MAPSTSFSAPVLSPLKAFFAFNEGARKQSLLALGGIAFYILFRFFRPHVEIDFLRDSFPSLLFPLVAFSLTGAMLRCRGGCGGNPLSPPLLLVATVMVLVLFEGIAPGLDRGTADWKDGAALFLGSAFYFLFTRESNRSF